MKYTPSKLRRLEENSKLEVENIIEAAFTRDECIATELESMSDDFNWCEENIVDGRRCVPFAKWARFACTFIRDGYTGLVSAYDGENDFSLAFLEAYKTPESVYSILEIAKKLGNSASVKSKEDIANAINLLLSFKGGSIIDESKIDELRDLLHSYFNQDLEESKKVSIYCALRGVGNQSSIDLIEMQEKLSDPWRGLESQVIKSIRNRVKKNA